MSQTNPRPTPAGGLFSVCSAGFIHPATMVGGHEVRLMRARIAARMEPYMTALKKLSDRTPVNVVTHALVEVNVGFNGVGQGHKEFVEWDGVQAYQNALMWLCTDNEQYARNVATLVDAWATTCQKFVGDNAPLEGGWGCSSFTRAIELVKHTWPGWDPQVESRWLGFLDRHILVDTCLYSPRYQSWAQGNWHTTAAECKMQIALLRSDRALFDEALGNWRKALMEMIDPETGESVETKRDMYHAQFGLGGLVQVAEMCRQQGVLVYREGNDRLWRTLEFHANIILGRPPPNPPVDYPIKGNGFQPTGWEAAFNQIDRRLGLPMPNTKELLARFRPEMYTFHWGLGTLTHHMSASAVDLRNLYNWPGPPLTAAAWTSSSGTSAGAPAPAKEEGAQAPATPQPAAS